MKEILDRINAAIDAFRKDAEQQAEKGNKAAGTRARKASLALEKDLKEFRKKSLEAAAKQA